MSFSPIATQRARARVGTLLNEKWRIDSLLGIGGMAAVYGATHRNGKRAALKVLHAELVADPSLVARFLREGYLANKVEHPGVVSVLDDAHAEDGSPYLVMELLDGYSLERHTQTPANALQLSQVLKITDELLDVLAAAHAKGIVHRDIKPANLFLTRDGKVKVLDFGIARLAETSNEGGLTQTGAAIGTPSYMPPEQARGKWTEVDARTDLWAVGATMLALLLGQRPRRADTVQEELFVAMTAPMPSTSSLCPHVPVDVARAIDCAVAFEREQRFPDATAMQLERRRAASADGGAPAFDQTLVVPSIGDTAPVMHPGLPAPPIGHANVSSPITSPSHGSGSHGSVSHGSGSYGGGAQGSGAHQSPSYGSTVQMSEPQLTTGRPMWVAPPSSPPAPRRGSAVGIALAFAAITLVALGFGGSLAWKRHLTMAEAPRQSPSIAAANPVAPALTAVPVPTSALDPAASASASDSAPAPASASTLASTSASASASAASASASAVAAPRASTAPRAPTTPRGTGPAPADTAGFFDKRF
jgi:serine/threonine protein kinase